MYFLLAVTQPAADRYADHLAGMECSKKSYSVEGASAHSMRREEARHINTSLCKVAGTRTIGPLAARVYTVFSH